MISFHDWKRPVVRRFIYITLFALFALLMSFVFLAPTNKKIATDKFKYLDCPKCGFEIPFQEHLLGKPCPKCKTPKGEFIGSIESVKKMGSPPNPWHSFNVAIIIGIVAYLGAVVLALSFPPKDPEDEFLTFNCRNCHRNLRYRKRSAGQIGQCPNCRKPVLFPKEFVVIETDDENSDEVEEEIEDRVP